MWSDKLIQKIYSHKIISNSKKVENSKQTPKN